MGRARIPGSSSEKHDSKGTFYLTEANLLAIDRMRLDLRSRFGLRLNKSGLIRAAICHLAETLAQGGDLPICLQREQEP